MKRQLWLLALAGCQQELTPPPPPPAPVAVARTPFVIHDLLVGEDGQQIKKLPELPSDAIAVPDGPHRFIAGEFAIDTATGTVTKQFPKAAIADDKLVRYEPDGKVRWTTTAVGARSVRPPDIAVGGRTLVSLDAELHAFDDATGKPAWTAKIEGFRLQIHGTTAFSTMCNEPTKDHWVIATDVATGAEKFRVPLAMDCDPWLDVTDDFVIAVDRHDTRVFDHAGKTLLQLDEEVQGKPMRAGELVLVATDKHLLALDRHAKIVWKRDHLRETFVAGSQLVVLPGGDLLLASYGAISDSGVELVRLHPDGTTVWHSNASSLGVAHSEYQHFAYIEPRDNDLFVISEGSYGAFLEKLSVATGERELRYVLPQPCTKP